MTEQKVYIEISGGCYQSATNVPKGWTVALIDWTICWGTPPTQPRNGSD